MFRNMKAKVMAIGAGLALMGGVIGGAAIMSATTTGAQTPATTSQQQTATGAKDQPETGAAEAPETGTAGKSESAEPALAGGGHQDTVANADHQFEGVE